MTTLLLIALWIWLALAAPASAGPIVGAIGALVGAWGSASLVVKIVVGLALNIGMSLIEQARARKAATNRQSGVKLTVQMGDDVPRSYLLGLRATAGVRRYIGVWGAEGKSPNANLVDVRELSCLPSYAGPTGLQAASIGDKAVTVLWSEPHADGRGYPVQEYRVNGVDFLWIKYLDGTQTTADPYLRAKFGAHADRPWKASMIGRGCQGVIMTMRWHQDLYKQGLPQALFAPVPMRLYDLRKDTTAGGSGPQRWGDPATWAPSDNLAVMAYNVARGIHYDGRWVHGGRNFAAHRLPASAWMAAINEADRDMGSGRRQFRGGLEIALDETGLDVLEKIRLGCAGRFAEVGGSLKLLVGAPAAAVYAISDETIVVTREQDFQPFPSIRSVCNTVRATYSEPEQGWAMKDAPARSSAALVARDGGQELAVDVAFEAVDDVAQVQCLTKTMIDEEQRWRRHQLVLPPSARPLEPNDVLSWSSERGGYSDKKFIISEIARLAGCLWRVVIEEIDPSDYDPPSVILPKVVGPTGVIPIPVQNMDGWTAVPASIDDGIGAARRPAVRVGCAAELEDVDAVHVQIKIKETGQLVYDNAGATPYPEPGTGAAYDWLLSGTWAVPDERVLVRGRYVPHSRRKTNWSGWIEVKLLPLRFSSDDILDEAITELKLADRAVSSLKIQLEAVKAELIANQAAIASKIADAAITTAKFAAGVRPVETVAALPGAPHLQGRVVLLTSDNKLYRNTGSDWVASVAAADIAGQVAAAQIAGIEATQITGQITGVQIGDDAISTPKLAAGAVIAGKIAAGAVLAIAIAAGAVTTDKLDALVVTAEKLASDSVVAGKVAAGAINAREIAAGAVIASKMTVSDWTNLVPDSDMTDIAVWSSSGNATHSVGVSSSAQVWTNFESKGWLQLASTDTVYAQVWGTLFPVSPGDELLFSAQLRGNVATADANYDIIFRADPTSANNPSNVTVEVTAQVSRFTRSVVVPAGMRYAYVRFAIPGGSAVTNLRIGGVKVLRKSRGELIVDGAIYAEKLAVGAVTTTKVAAGAITATELGAGAVTAVKIAAGAVTAQKISVANLAAIHGVLGEVDISSAQIGTLTVGTSNLDFSAVTTSYQMQRSSPGGPAPSAWTLIGAALTVQNPNPNPMFSDINLSLSVSVSGVPAAAGVLVETQVRIRNNTTGEVIYQDAVGVTGDGGGAPRFGSKTVNVFRLAMDNNQGGNSIRVEWRVINPGFVHAVSPPAVTADVRMLLWKR